MKSMVYAFALIHLVSLIFGAECFSVGSSPTVVIVGSGVGGLSTASRIASSSALPDNTKIIILEKNSIHNVGGRCGSFFRDVPKLGRFRHERGPSLLLLKDVYEDLFRDCGKDPNDFGLEIVQCEPAYQVVFEDGDGINLGFRQSDPASSKLENESREKMNTYETNGALKWDEYMTATEAFLDCGLPNFIEEKLDILSFPSFLKEATKDNFKNWPLFPHSKVLDATFSSTKMKALASFQDLYVGLEPFANKSNFASGVIHKTAPAVFGLLSALELHPTNKKGGVFAPIGGFQAVSSSFEKLARSLGVDIQYDTTVTRVTDEGVWYKAKDSSEQAFLPADLVIVNADLPFATKTLMPNSGLAGPKAPKYDWDDTFNFSSGVIAFHWALDKEFPQLNTHNVFMIGENDEKAEQSWAAVRLNDPSVTPFDGHDFPFNFYVHRPKAVDKTAAPDNCDSIMVLVPCCTLKRDEELSALERSETIKGYESQFEISFVNKVRTCVLDRLSRLEGIDDISSHIVDEIVDTPASYGDHYNLAAGTPFALSHGFGQLSLTRPAHESEKEDILFVGASTRPGNGVPLVLLGAKQVADKAIKRVSKKIKQYS
jgi:phytoene desaturase (3,4-didehydrolycopene-forming)